jgi:hypothetical protein
MLRCAAPIAAKLLPEQEVVQLLREAARRGGGGGVVQAESFAEVRVAAVPENVSIHVDDCDVSAAF